MFSGILKITTGFSDILLFTLDGLFPLFEIETWSLSFNLVIKKDKRYRFFIQFLVKLQLLFQDEYVCFKYK